MYDISSLVGNLLEEMLILKYTIERQGLTEHTTIDIFISSALACKLKSINGTTKDLNMKYERDMLMGHDVYTVEDMDTYSIACKCNMNDPVVSFILVQI